MHCTTRKYKPSEITTFTLSWYSTSHIVQNLSYEGIEMTLFGSFPTRNTSFSPGSKAQVLNNCQKRKIDPREYLIRKVTGVCGESLYCCIKNAPNVYPVAWKCCEKYTGFIASRELFKISFHILPCRMIFLSILMPSRTIYVIKGHPVAWFLP